jgi:hypothetical protein
VPPGVDVGAGGVGLRVFPRTGRALVFWSKAADGGEDDASLHAAEPVLRGIKYIVTRWMKEVEDGEEAGGGGGDGDSGAW